MEAHQAQEDRTEAEEMTAQEVIKELTRIIEERGDLDIYCDGEINDNEFDFEGVGDGDDKWNDDLPVSILLI